MTRPSWTDLREDRGHFGVAGLGSRAARERPHETLLVHGQVRQAGDGVVQGTATQFVEHEREMDEVAGVLLQRTGAVDDRRVVAVESGDRRQLGDDAPDELALSEERGDQDAVGVQLGEQQGGRRTGVLAAHNPQLMLRAQPVHVGLGCHVAHQVTDLLFVDDAVAEGDGEERLLADCLEDADNDDFGTRHGRGDRGDLARGAGNGALAGAGGVQVEQGLPALHAVAHADQV